MAIQRTSKLMTIGGILSAFGASLVGVPLIVIQAYAQIVKDGVPHWFSILILPMLLLGFILAAAGTAIMGVAGRGQDDIPTAPQVEAATKQTKAETPTQAAEAEAQAEAAKAEASKPKVQPERKAGE